MSTREMEPHWEKIPRSSSTEVDHGMLPTYRRLVGSSDAIVTVVCFVLAKVRRANRDAIETRSPSSFSAESRVERKNSYKVGDCLRIRDSRRDIFRALEQSAWKTRKAHMFFRKLFLQAFDAFIAKTVARRAATARFCPSETHIYHYQ